MQNYEKQESISVGCEVPAFLIQVGLPTENPLDRDPPLDRDHPLIRNMGLGSQTASDINIRWRAVIIFSCWTYSVPSEFLDHLSSSIPHNA